MNDDDLLNWMPPELVERARVQAERDAQSAAPGKSGRFGRTRAQQKPVRYVEPPRGEHRGRSLAAAVLGALLLTGGSLWQALGTRAPASRGTLWLALWAIGQAAGLCVYLLCLFPMGNILPIRNSVPTSSSLPTGNKDPAEKKLRRPALIAALGAHLLFGMAASVVAELRKGPGNDSPAVWITAMVIAPLLALAFAPGLWLLLGALRRKTTEKFAAFTAGVSLAVGLLGLILTLTGGKAATAQPPVHISALNLAQSLCFLYLIATWPVLDRAVLTNPDLEGADHGQPE